MSAANVIWRYICLQCALCFRDPEITSDFVFYSRVLCVCLFVSGFVSLHKSASRRLGVSTTLWEHSIHSLKIYFFSNWFIKMRMEKLSRNAQGTHSKDFCFSWWQKVRGEKERI